MVTTGLLDWTIVFKGKFSHKNEATGLGGAGASVSDYNAGGNNPGSSLGRERRIEERPRGPDIVHPKAGTDISCEFKGC